ncbi:glycosyltransferase family 10 [Geotalea sp. SG265]|uniref:glycosyltransferase family 10 domain-containing protein n=1 Tax=Geotalea sp. SG265 TaxID=2922867 RepID=UPI001FAFDDB5|nr:glycosyltransferase family 10 [Geotalea sp. SG265]
MLTVKVSTNSQWCFERQTPNFSGIWSDCHFLINQDVEECDFWVVYEGLTKEERTRCPVHNTLLITGEPPAVRSYDKHFLTQFGTVITCNRALQHPNLIFSQQGLPWMIGAEWDCATSTWGHYKSFEELSRPVINKNKLLSVVASSKLATKGHIARHEFIKMLMAELGSSLDVFGHGRDPVIDKWQAIAPYRYHLAIENSSIEDYWTEKLADSLLGEALPIYHGCSNIEKYFSTDVVQVIDIYEPRKAVDKIIKIIDSDLWIRQKNNIADLKRKILYEYNMFNIISNCIHTQIKANCRVYTCTMRPEEYFQSKINRYNYYLKKYCNNFKYTK